MIESSSGLIRNGCKHIGESLDGNARAGRTMATCTGSSPRGRKFLYCREGSERLSCCMSAYSFRGSSSDSAHVSWVARRYISRIVALSVELTSSGLRGVGSKEPLVPQ